MRERDAVFSMGCEGAEGFVVGRLADDAGCVPDGAETALVVGVMEGDGRRTPLRRDPVITREDMLRAGAVGALAELPEIECRACTRALLCPVR